MLLISLWNHLKISICQLKVIIRLSMTDAVRISALSFQNEKIGRFSADFLLFIFVLL